MKRLTYMALAVATAAMTLTGCDSDADKMYVDGLESSTLLVSQDEIVLESGSAAMHAVTFLWTNDSKLKIYGTSTAGVADKSMPTYTLEMSLTEDFANAYSQNVDNGVVSYTVQELNTIVMDLGAKPFEKTSVFVRLTTALGNNGVDSKPSDVHQMHVTCYKVSYTTAKMIDKDKAAEIATLYSADTDGDGEPDVRGEYKGFVGAASWSNFFLRENDGTIWGNVGKDASEFLASKDNDCWNFWYPGMSGCYFTEVNVSDEVETKQWIATYIPSLSISGDVSGEMTYIRAENRWMCVVTTTADNQTFSISGTGKKYDKESKTDDAAATDTQISFGTAAEGKLVVGGGEKFTVEKAGTYTISLYLADYSNLTYEIKAGEEEVEEPAPKSLFVLGLNDSWEFNHEMVMIDEDNLIYRGVFGSNTCPWGYQIAKEKDNFDDVFGGTDHSGGELVAGKESNIAIETPGVYLWEVDWKNMTYKTTAVTKVSYTGLNDNWDLHAMTADAANPSKYTATVSIEKASEWGGQIIINENWDIKVGGSDGTIEYGESKNFTDDKNLEAGDYFLTFDFAAGTYSFTSTSAVVEYPEALYAIGVDGKYGSSDWVTLSASETGVYSGTITITDDSAKEFEVYEDVTYTTKVGPNSNTTITVGTDAWKFYVSEPASGTYTLTISLVNNTWSIVKSE